MSDLIQYAQRGRNTWWAWLLGPILGFTLALVAGVLITIAVMLAGAAPPDLAQQIARPTHPRVFFITTGVTFGCILAGLAASAWLVQAKRPTDLIGDWRWRGFVAGAAAWSLAQVAAAALDYALAPASFRLTASAATLELALAAVPALAVQTFAEEFVFRGLATQGLRLLLPPLPCALASGALFAVVHIPNGWPQAANALVFGVAAAWIALRTGGLATTFGMHLANNLFGALVVVSTADVFRGAPGLFTQQPLQGLWVDVMMQGALMIALTLVITRMTRTQPGTNT
ncbi:CPBP family intramembrane glutamic endopeptidase [Caulobacter sp. KR2-114]|uniref:CPBP family intramembrane glutamic endopeptidase n=1 Tax=Caulobacter sp. KR2-114 TaxID=3400912 RepID=UPI003C04FA61